MPKQVVMPQLGEAVLEGTLSRWLKNKGERVEEFEPLLEVNTDKVDTEIPSPAAGVVLDILVESGATIQVGTLLAWIGEEGEALGVADDKAGSASQSNQPLAQSQPQPAALQGAASPPVPGRHAELGFISPVVAKIAAEQNVDLRQVQGSGLGGRITRLDLEDFLKRRQTSTPAVSKQTLPQPAVTAGLADDEILPLTPVRRAIAEHMSLSRRTSPHATTIMEADLSRVIAHRQANKEAFASDGVNLTYTAYFVTAAVAALKLYPIANASWSEAGIAIHRQINIGMATALGDAGLIVPVIRDADRLSLLGLARMINDLASRARARQLKPDEVKGGTFTITNHGTTGSLFAAPIINQPQCAILGVGAIRKRAMVITDPLGNDAIAIRPMAYLSLTFDHRILDGAVADYFLAKVVEFLEHMKL